MTYYLINNTYNSGTTDSMLFSPIVKEGDVVVSTNQEEDAAPTTIMASFKYFWRFTAWVKKEDTLYITSSPFYWFYFIQFSLFMRGTSPKVIFHAHDLYPDFFKLLPGFKFKLLYWFLRLPCKWLVNRAHAVIVLSTKMKEYVGAKYGHKNIVLVENWSDLSNSEKIEAPILNKIVYIGNIGFAHDTSAIEAAVQQNRDKSFIFKVSAGNKYHKLRNPNLERVLGLEGEENVEIINRRLPDDELERLMDECDFSLLVIGEGYDQVLFPCKVYSSINRGIPVLLMGDKNSYLYEWIKANNLGCHIDDLAEGYDKISLYRKSMVEYRKFSNLAASIKALNKTIRE